MSCLHGPGSKSYGVFGPGKSSRRFIAAVLGAVVIASAAQVSVPVWGSQVPQSLQTLAVLVTVALLGPRFGALSLAIYLLIGAAGLPVFADGTAGARHLIGPTAGYLLGFVGAAATVGYLAHRRPGRFIELLLFMVLGHVIILTLGWARLAFTIGVSEALMRGVAPFIWGGVLKSVVAALVVQAISSRNFTPSAT